MRIYMQFSFGCKIDQDNDPLHRHLQPRQAPRLRRRRTRGNITLAPLPNLKEIPAPAEDEPTFEGNARLKAIYYSNHAPGQIVIADDSGLEVDALHGAPGVRSARYADDQKLPNRTQRAQQTSATISASSKPSPKSPGPSSDRPATTASSPPPATDTSSPPATAPSKARSSPPPAEQRLRLRPLFYLPTKTRPWPNSTSKPSSPSATAAEPSPPSSKRSHRTCNLLNPMSSI